MAVMTPRQDWTDERLDHFERRVDERFDNFESKVDERFKQVDERFERVDERLKEIDKRFGQVDKRLERIETNISEMNGALLGVQRMMLQGFLSICTVMVAGFVAIAGGL